MMENLRQYILEHFQPAMDAGFIKVYYQPVIRTVSCRLCSLEALARWEDPVYGLINPDEFIPVLEEERLIHLLDGFVVNQVCRVVRRMLDGPDTPVPVSINLSRLDFALCDIFTVVDETVARYRLPHDFLYIEITESVVAEQEELVRQVVDRFHHAGYQLWMDDFGSGYSSLNMLKDYPFNEIKMDMRFLSSFSQRSRRILTSVVQMAKEIGIQTLAEGVETEEQFDYLRNIGCEKVQGFYFGKPLPLKETFAGLREKNVAVEAPQDRKYYDDIGKINVLSAVPFMTQTERDALVTARQLNSIPLAVAEVGEAYFSVLFYNTAFEETAAGTGISSLAAVFREDRLRLPQDFSLLPAKVLNFLEGTRSTGDGKMFFVSGEDYYELKAKRVAGTKGAFCVLLRLSNLSQAGEGSRRGTLDDAVRQIYTLFDRVTMLNVSVDTITPLYVSMREYLSRGLRNIRKLAVEYAEKWIFPEDREAYLRFMDTDTVDERTQRSGRTYITAYFRTVTGHGDYRWKQYFLLRLDADSVLSITRDAHDDILSFQRQHARTLPETERSGKEAIPPALLWENLIRSDILNLFWKNRERRFLGASRGFMDYYGFHSPEEFTGKTDEDLGWHVHPDPFMNDELHVIREGFATHNVAGYCISGGENREILASKIPVYDENGRILGLLGCFTDKNLLEDSGQKKAESKRRDPLTKLLNSRGLYEEAHVFKDEYFLRNVDFIRMHVAIDDIASINRRHGFDFGDRVIAELGSELKKYFGLASAVGRYDGFKFAVLRQIRKKKDVFTMLEAVRRIPDQLREIDGIPVTLYLSVGFSRFSESEDLSEQEQQAEIRLLADNNEHATVENRISKASEIFRLYDDLPISFAVYKVAVNRNNEVRDAVIFYVNHQFEHLTGKPARELLGRGTKELFPELGQEWYEIAGRAALLGETITGNLAGRGAGPDCYLTASQVIRPGFCSFTYQELDASFSDKTQK